MFCTKIVFLSRVAIFLPARFFVSVSYRKKQKLEMKVTIPLDFPLFNIQSNYLNTTVE